MRDYFTLNGVSSKEFGVYIADGSRFKSAERDYDTIEIPGRNGTLTLDKGRFKNVSHSYTAYIADDLSANLEGFRAWLLETSAYRILKDTINPYEYYKARYVGNFDTDKADRISASFKIEFDRMPQRFLEDGDMPLEDITGATSVFNAQRYEALPLIRAYGTGWFTIGDVKITITSASTYTDIDCELQEAYKDTLATNCNGNIVLNNGKFPSFKPGINNITLSGISKLQITPRWWTI